MEAIKNATDIIFRWLGIWLAMNALTAAGQSVRCWWCRRTARREGKRVLHVSAHVIQMEPEEPTAEKPEESVTEEPHDAPPADN